MNIKASALHFFSLRSKTLFMISALTLTAFANAFAQASLTELKEPILTVRELYFNTSNHHIDGVTDINVHPEFWTVDQLDTHTQAFRISGYHGEKLYTEIYLVKDGGLIYALEEVKGMPLNRRTQSIWRCEYFIKEGQVIDYTSLGHGKTEDDAWRPEDILVQFSKRKAEFEKIQK